jgi:hypothetical protein
VATAIWGREVSLVSGERAGGRIEGVVRPMLGFIFLRLAAKVIDGCFASCTVFAILKTWNL